MKRNVSITNRRATYDYRVVREYVAGIELLGSEVRSIRNGLVNLLDAYCYLADGQAFGKNMSVQNSDRSSQHDPERVKRLLLNRSELDDMQSELTKGRTIIVLGIIEVRGKIKLRIAVAEGKKNYDKRNAIRERDMDRDMRRDTV